MQLKTYNAQNVPHKVAPKVNKNLRFSFNSKGRPNPPTAAKCREVFNQDARQI